MTHVKKILQPTVPNEMIVAREKGERIHGLDSEGLNKYIQDISSRNSTGYYSNGKTFYGGKG